MVNCGPRSEVISSATPKRGIQGSRTGLSGGVGQWNGFRPPSETVDDHKEVLHALGLIKGAHQVDMEAAKTTVRWWSLCERCLNVAVNL